MADSSERSGRLSGREHHRCYQSRSIPDAPTSDYNDEQVENVYNHLQGVNGQTPTKYVTIVLGDWNAKDGKDTYKDWRHVHGPHCNPEINERELRLPELAGCNTGMGKHTMT